MTFPRSRRLARGTVALAAVLLAVVPTLPSRAGAAAARGTAAGLESVTAGTWAATVESSPLTFTLPSSQSDTVTNTGTIALSGITYQVVVSTPVVGLPRFTMAVCTVPWSLGRCDGRAGTAVGGTFDRGSTTTVTSTVVPPVGGSIYLQVTETGISTAVTVSLSASISAATQLRSPQVTNQ